jgi:hypothetical protein
MRETLDAVLVEQPTDPGRVFYMRPSSLPFCPLKKFLVLARDGVPKSNYMNAGGLFYTSVGTTVHEVFQALFGRGGQMIGNWHCKSCGTVRQHATYNAKCKKCGKDAIEPDHQEISVKHLHGWRGHLDNVFRTERGKLWVIDYKTTNQFFINNPKSLPPVTYQQQQMSYVPLLETLLGKPVEGWCLAYMGRDNPLKQRRIFSHRMTAKEKATTLDNLKLYSQLNTDLLVATKVSHIKPLYDHRLCQSKEHHDELFKYEGCPFKKQCFDRPKMVSLIKTTVKTSGYLPLITAAPQDIQKDLFPTGMRGYTRLSETSE